MGIMSLAEIMDRSVDILKKYIKSIIIFNLIYGIIAVVGIVILIVIGGIFGGVTMLAAPNIPILVVGASIMAIAVATIFISMNIGMIKISSQEFLSQEVYASEAIGASIKSFFKVYGIIFLGVLIALPILIIFWAIFYFLFKAFDNSMINLGVFNGREIILIILSIISFISAVLAFLAYITIFSFSFHALIIEKKGIFASIKRSYSLVKNSFWKIFGIIILISLVIYAINYSLQSIGGALAGIIYLVLKFLNVQQDFIGFISTIYNTASWPVSILSWIVISPLGSIMLTLLYFNQRFKKEGYDILLELKKIERDKERKELSENTERTDSI